MYHLNLNFFFTNLRNLYTADSYQQVSKLFRWLMWPILTFYFAMNLGSNYVQQVMWLLSWLRLRKNHSKTAILIQNKTDIVKRQNNIFEDIPNMTFSYKSIKSRSGVIHLGVVTVDVFWSFCSCWSALGALESKWIIAEIMLDSSTIFAAKTLHWKKQRKRKLA